MLLSKKIFVIILFILANIKAVSQDSLVKYYRACDGLNNPILVHFSKPIKESQTQLLSGRYFKLTYNINRRTRVYRLDKIEHYYLNKPQR